MKKIALALLLSASFLAASAQTAKSPLGVTVRRAATVQAAATTGTSSPYTTYDFNWNYTPNLPVCVSKNIACYDGFIFTNTTTGQVVGNQSQIGPTALSWAYTPAGGIPYGNVTFSEVAHGYDETGAEVVSATPATVTVSVHVTALNGPTNLQAKTQ